MLKNQLKGAIGGRSKRHNENMIKKQANLNKISSKKVQYWTKVDGKECGVEVKVQI